MTHINLAGVTIIKNKSILVLYKIKEDHFEFPGGKVESDETIKEAAVREAKEEIGVDVLLQHKFPVIKFKMGLKEFHSNQFLAKIINGEPQIKEPDKFSKIFWMPLKDYKHYKIAKNLKKFCEEYKC